jgi:predicted MFS family arabinose efflux permease
MSLSGHHHALSPGRERATLLTLGAVQFTHILDFMIMMPLGASLMREFNISPAQFTQLVACYGLAAAVSGLAGGFFLDRFDRKRALLVLYAGFGLATFACGLAPTHHWLMIARLAAGAFGGLAGSLVTAMVGDIIPPARRGRAMSLVMSAFPVASVLGIPVGLVLAGKFGWHAPFFMLGGCAAVNLLLGALALPHLRTAIQNHNPLRQMREIVSRRVHLRAFALGGLLVMGGGVLIPFIAPTFIANVGIDEKIQLPLLYVAGGAATMISMPLIGWLSDHVNRLWLFVWLSVFASAVVLVIVRMGPSSVGFAALMMALFMIPMSGRFSPAMTMITNAVEARYRGGFMSVNAALQQATSGLANILAGGFVTRNVTGHLDGYPLLGYVSVGFFFLAVLCAVGLRNAAPHVALPAKKDAPPPAHVEAEAFT